MGEDASFPIIIDEEQEDAQLLNQASRVDQQKGSRQVDGTPSLVSQLAGIADAVESTKQPPTRMDQATRLYHLSDKRAMPEPAQKKPPPQLKSNQSLVAQAESAKPTMSCIRNRGAPAIFDSTTNVANWWDLDSDDSDDELLKPVFLTRKSESRSDHARAIGSRDMSGQHKMSSQCASKTTKAPLQSSTRPRNNDHPSAKYTNKQSPHSADIGSTAVAEPRQQKRVESPAIAAFASVSSGASQKQKPIVLNDGDTQFVHRKIEVEGPKANAISADSAILESSDAGREDEGALGPKGDFVTFPEYDGSEKPKEPQKAFPHFCRKKRPIAKGLLGPKEGQNKVRFGFDNGSLFLNFRCMDTSHIFSWVSLDDCSCKIEERMAGTL